MSPIQWQLVTAWLLVLVGVVVLWGVLALIAYGVYLLVT
jgi:hypothetical protein